LLTHIVVDPSVMKPDDYRHEKFKESTALDLFTIHTYGTVLRLLFSFEIL